MSTKCLVVCAMLASLASCTSEDAARALAERVIGPGARCVTDEQYKSTDVTFCTNGKTLVICVNEDECLVVNLMPEREPRSDASSTNDCSTNSATTGPG